MEPIEIRRRPVIPSIARGGMTGGAVAGRVDRYLAVVSGPPVAMNEATEAVELMGHLTSARTAVSTPVSSAPTRAGRGRGLTMFAPLRRLRRLLWRGV